MAIPELDLTGDCLNDDFISKSFEANVRYDKIEYHLHKGSSTEDNDHYIFKMMNDHPVQALDLLYEKYAPA